MLPTIVILICIISALILILLILRNELEDKHNKIVELQNILKQRFTDAFNDPQLRSFRILLPDELEEIKNSALIKYNNDMYGLHSECHKTLLIVLNTLYSGSLNG